MTNANMIEAKPDLLQLIKTLENNGEEVIYIAQNGVKIAQLTLIPQTEKPKKRIGVAKGKFTIPENFDEMDKEIEEMFEGYL